MAKKVLIIEDNERNRMLERDLLEVAGYQVLEAENSRLGLEIAKQEMPDIVLLDVRLPDINGIEVANLLKSDPKTQRIPVVFVTASVIGENLEAVKKVSEGRFITKPINTRTFAAEIAAFIERDCR